jgi:hypothetical protein
MKGNWLFVLGAACGVAVMLLPKAAAHLHAATHALHGDRTRSGAPRAHSEEKFVFTANAPMEQVAPLLGADKERVWSPGWDPQFVYPLPAADAQGMVFSVAHHHLRSIWVNTELNLKNGRVQYVYVIPDALVTVITLNLTPKANQTIVEVHYDRTALTPEADSHVREMAAQDRASGPEWEQQINQYLEKIQARE